MYTLVLAFTILFSANNTPVDNTQLSDNLQHYYHGTVIDIIDDSTDDTNFERIQTVNVILRDKEVNGQIITIQHRILLTSVKQIIVSPNDRVIIWANNQESDVLDYRIYDFERDSYLFYLLILFILAILIIGGRNGLSSITSLGITLCIIFLVFFPMILNDISPLIAAVITCILSTVITLIIVGKPSVKTISAILGTLGGICIAGSLTYLFGYHSHLRGIQNESVEMLSYIQEGHHLNFMELLFAGILIGSLGAVMDVCMSIASAMDEIFLSCSKINYMDLFISGMRIGKDIMGTMTNTLILAYVGSSINILLIYYLYGLSFIQFINSEQIACEILRSLAGSIGLILSIPITAITFSLLIKNNQPLKSNRMKQRFFL